MAKVIAIGQPVNDAERQAIAFLRDHLTDTYVILHNFEIWRGNEFFEVDLAVIAPHAVYLVDVKGTRGNIDVYGGKWFPERRQPFSSPLPKLRGHAKALSGLISDSNHSDPELRKVYCDVAVILTSADAHLADTTGKDAPFTTKLAKCAQFFQDATSVPPRFLNNIRKYSGTVIKAIQGSARAVTRPPQFGNWLVDERLGGTDTFTEYRAYNVHAGKGSGRVLLRVYSVDPYATAEERAAELRRISNGFRALNCLPSHPAIQAARDFFPTEDEDRFVLVVEDTTGQSLRLHIEKPDQALTFDQKIRVVRDLLSGLAHAHAHDVVHRNICPSTILFGVDGQSRLINFDYARSGAQRTSTIAGEIVDDLEPAYQALECFQDPGAATAKSDVFSMGVVLFELFIGQRPFVDATEMLDQSCQFSLKPSQQNSGLPVGFDDWLQSLCSQDTKNRPAAAEALGGFEALLAIPEDSAGSDPSSASNSEHSSEATPVVAVDYHNLPVGYELTRNYMIQEKLGDGGFGVVYKVIDTLGDMSRVVKIITKDRRSVIDRLKLEYRNLLNLPKHKYVVEVLYADFLPGNGPPFIVFAYVDGLDVGELVESRKLTLAAAWEMGLQVLEGIAHLHANNVSHCDIKPRNLLWTAAGVKIIDFNVSVITSEEIEHSGGTSKYLPPDYDKSATPTADDLQDRDLYAFVVTVYQTITGRYPWNSSTPPRDTPIRDPRSTSGCADIAPAVVDFLLKGADPRRANRFRSAEEMLQAMRGIKTLRLAAREETEGTTTWTVPTAFGGSPRPNTNPFVDFLLTLYSQGHNNRGTRGLDVLGGEVYVDTAMDQELIPATLAGEFRLVVITGNAGDGKTAFLQKLEKQARNRGAVVTPAARGNGVSFEIESHRFQSNYDGSQDEGDVSNDDVLNEFFSPFRGDDAFQWPTGETRLIAINEGRLVDFLLSHIDDFRHLLKIVRHGLETGVPDEGIALVNLNLRSIVADGVDGQPSILERLLKRITHRKFWKHCHSCDLREKCYVQHNVRTFQDDTAGPIAMERLKTLYTLTSLRGRLHITLRDLGSALAYTVAGTRTCDEIHDLYASGNPDEIANGFYFNSWMGGESGSADRLLSLLAEIDVGQVSDPRLDRMLDFQPPAELKGLLRFEFRGNYDTEILDRLYKDLPWDHSGRPTHSRFVTHQSYVAITRRRHYFERLDDSWRRMLPYQSAGQMLQLVRDSAQPSRSVLQSLIRAINLGEGLINPEHVQNKLVLQVRDVPNGSLRSYKLFPADRFDLLVADSAYQARFVEHMPASLVLRYTSESGAIAELDVNLDVFEMLWRLNQGYRPTIEELQGYYLSLGIFKNILGSAPYQEILLTDSGHDFFRIQREDGGRLRLEHVGAEV